MRDSAGFRVNWGGVGVNARESHAEVMGSWASWDEAWSAGAQQRFEGLSQAQLWGLLGWFGWVGLLWIG